MPPCTTVIGETWTLRRRRSGHVAAVGFLDRFDELPDVEVVHMDGDIEKDAWRWLRGRPDGEYSFVDATSFSVMRRRRIREALAFDGDVNAAGFCRGEAGVTRALSRKQLQQRTYRVPRRTHPDSEMGSPPPNAPARGARRSFECGPVLIGQRRVDLTNCPDDNENEGA